MATTLRNWTLRCMVAGLLCSAIPAAADEPEGILSMRPEAEGVVRISDARTSPELVRGQSDGLTVASHGTCQHGYANGQGCPQCPQTYCPEEWVVVDGGACKSCWLDEKVMELKAKCAMERAIFHDELKADLHEKAAWARCKFGYFVPTGACGKGAPIMGHYNMVYPLDPGYFDPRDGQVYAAQGYNGPVAVPLAPVVNHTYNYGWGIPSSRLTPVSHPTNIAPAAINPSLYPMAPIAR